jgi:pimeloyl-ACP methyl ester carboxylesterase
MPDLAGHGLSGRPDASYTLEWHAGVVGAWLRAIDLDDVDMVGHSFGGGVAQWMLLEHRSHIRRLALVAAGGLGREVGLALRLASISHVVERLGQPFMAHGTRMALKAAGSAYAPNDIAELARLNATPGTARAFARSVRDVIDWRGQYRHFLDRAHEVGQLPPIALFWGEDDTVIPLAHAIEAMSVIQGITLTRFSGCGHFPHRQDPERFVLALEAFLDAPLAFASVPPPKVVPSDSARPAWQRAWYGRLGRGRSTAGAARAVR